jgi:type IV pilus assembly protein PilW
MKIQSYPNRKGITLIELLVALVICGLVIAGIYRVFVAQTKAYSIQDQVVEVQQNVRSAMEILLRDLRMAGYDDDNASSAIVITDPIFRPVAQNSIKVNYENYNMTTLPPQYEKHEVAYWLDGVTSELKRQRTVTPGGAGTLDILLENVDAFNITYGVDVNEDGAMDDQNLDGVIDDNDWVQAAAVGNARVIALRVRLTARPDQTNPDVQKMVSPRSLESIVTLRNLFLIRE